MSNIDRLIGCLMAPFVILSRLILMFGVVMVIGFLASGQLVFLIPLAIGIAMLVLEKLISRITGTDY